LLFTRRQLHLVSEIRRICAEKRWERIAGLAGVGYISRLTVAQVARGSCPRPRA
jgi:hypothetical protein